jgi:hypothetical protein
VNTYTRRYEPGDRCPADWADPDGLLSVTYRPVGDRRTTGSRPGIAEVRGWELTSACMPELEPELRARRIIGRTIHQEER